MQPQPYHATPNILQDELLPYFALSIIWTDLFLYIIIITIGMVFFFGYYNIDRIVPSTNQLIVQELMSMEHKIIYMSIYGSLSQQIKNNAIKWSVKSIIVRPLH